MMQLVHSIVVYRRLLSTQRSHWRFLRLRYNVQGVNKYIHTASLRDLYVTQHLKRASIPFILFLGELLVSYSAQMMSFLYYLTNHSVVRPCSTG